MIATDGARSDGGAAPEQRRTLYTVALGTLLALVVFTMPLTSLTTIGAGLHADAGAQSWMLSSMSLGLAVALLTCGAVGDDFGRRRIFVAGAALLALSTAACAIAPTTLVFVLGRTAEGLGAAAVLACGLALIGHTFPSGPARTRATGFWGASFGTGIAIGPVLGPLVDWRTLYLALAVLAAALAVAGRAALTESRTGRPRNIDLPGITLLGSGLAALLAGLTQGRQGWTRPVEVGLLACGAGLLVGFLLRERYATSPMLDLALFRRPALVAATAGALATGAGVVAPMTFIATVLQRGLGRSQLDSALVLLAWSLTSAVAALLVRHLGNRVSAAARLAGGLVVGAACSAALAGLDTHTGDRRLLVCLVISGLATGLLNATLGREAVTSVPPTRSGVGSGINNAGRFLGSAIGVTVLVTIAVRPGAHPAGLVAGWNTGILVAAAISLLGAATVLGCRAVERARVHHATESTTTTVRRP